MNPRGLALGVISAIDTALWDLAGQAVGRLVYELLGGLYHGRPRIYASFIPKETSALLDDLRQAVAAGYAAVKVKLGAATYPGSGFHMGAGLNLGREREMLAAVGDVDVLVDVAQAVAPLSLAIPQPGYCCSLADERIAHPSLPRRGHRVVQNLLKLGVG